MKRKEKKKMGAGSIIFMALVYLFLYMPVFVIIGNEFVKMISLIFLNLTNRLKRNLLEPRVCIYP